MRFQAPWSWMKATGRSFFMFGWQRKTLYDGQKQREGNIMKTGPKSRGERDVPRMQYCLPMSCGERNDLL